MDEKLLCKERTLCSGFINGSLILSIALFPVLISACGGGGGGGSSSTPPPAVPAQVTGLSATPSLGQVALAWTAASGATSYVVMRATSGTNQFSPIATPTGTTYTDSSATPGTFYDYEVEGKNSGGDGAPSSIVSATPWATASLSISVDPLANRHFISPLVYGVNFPPNATYITDTGTPFVRWGGNNSTDYNWQTFNTNIDNDWFFQDAGFGALGLNTSSAGADSQQFVKDVVAAGADPLMTMPTLTTTGLYQGANLTAGWVAKGATGDPNEYTYFSFSKSKYNYTPCVTNPYESDDGDGIVYQSSCAGQSASGYTPSSPTYVTNNDLSDAYVPLLDSPGTSDPAGSVYRNQWAAALAPDFGSAPHFYDMDNEMDIWNSTHRDIHPNPVTYQDEADNFVRVSGVLKQADPQAVTFGPVSCCWSGYWDSGAGGTDKASHGSLDFWPWWLNDVDWRGEVQGAQLINDFDYHAYPENSVPSGASAAEIDQIALASVRGWWDTSFVDTNSWIGLYGATTTSMQPDPTVEARIVRAQAVVNSIMPGLPVSITEWNFGLNGEDPIAIALSDADAWGLLGQYDYYAAARWTAPYPSNGDATSQDQPGLELFTNYDGSHDGFDPISVKTANNCGLSSTTTPVPYDCSTFAAVNSAGTQVTLLVVNQSQWKELQANITLNNFTPSSETTYTISQANPTQISAGLSAPWSASQTFLPYSITLLVISGTGTTPSAEWALNPGLIPAGLNMPAYAPPGIVMMSQGTTVTLNPTITSGLGTVTLTSVTADAGVTATITQPNVTSATKGAITLTVPPTGTSPGFYNFTVTGQDSGGNTETEPGIVEVGTPAATLTATGNNQSGSPGGNLTLSVTVVPGSTAYIASGLEILFTTTSGTLSATSPVALSKTGNQVLVDTDSTGTATVTLTLPSMAGTVNVTAEAPYPVGHPTYTFTETVP